MKPHPMDINTNTRMRWEVIKKFPELGQLENKKILDVGAGLGYFSLKFSSLGADVLVVDVDKPSLDFISETYGIATRYLDAERENLPEGMFDLVFVGEVLEHVRDPLGLLQKAEAAVTPGGLILLSTPAMEGSFIYTKGKSLCHDHSSEKHERKGFYYHELQSYFEHIKMEIVRHKYCIYFFSEIFMQLTKLGYTMKKSQYRGQSDVLNTMSSLSYKVLSFFYPLLLQFFKAEQSICNSISAKGHCHIILACKPG